MRITIPFDYSISYVLKGRRSPSSAKTVSSADFEIRDVSLDQARLAFEVGHDVETANEANVFRRIDRRPARVWEVDGQYYSEILSVAEFPGAIMAPWTDRSNPMACFRSHGDSTPFGDGQMSGERNAVTQESVLRNDGQIRSWTDDGGTAKATSIQQRLNEMIVVDGHVCVAVTEPVIVVTPLGSNDFPGRPSRPTEVFLMISEMKSGGASSFHPHADIGQHHKGGRFRIDRKAEALDYAKRLAGTLGCQVNDRAVIGKIDPARLWFSDETETVQVVANHAASVLEPLVGYLPRTVASTWYKMRDALLFSGKSVTPLLVDALRSVRDAILVETPDDTEELRAWRKAWHIMSTDPSYRLLRSDNDPKRDLKVLAFYCDEAISKWERRPRDGDLEWADDAIDMPQIYGADLQVFELTTAASVARVADKLFMAPSTLLRKRQEEGTHFVLAKVGSHLGLAALNGQSGSLRIEDDVAAAYGRRAMPEVIKAVEDYVARANRLADLDAVLDFDDELSARPGP